ncbi:MAG: endo alpha-1,4 polygalactosaminidase [Anaerolineales bacterium]|nr:endo alpha-1,4 polygalactosaminidase [Anaerolineales bacterium]
MVGWFKNDLAQINELVDYYDFSVNEQCFEYDECNTLFPFINNGKPVLNAEYSNKYVADESARHDLCTESVNNQFSTLILPLNLDDEFRFSCL